MASLVKRPTDPRTLLPHSLAPHQNAPHLRRQRLPLFSSHLFLVHVSPLTKVFQAQTLGISPFPAESSTSPKGLGISRRLPHQVNLSHLLCTIPTILNPCPLAPPTTGRPCSCRSMVLDVSRRPGQHPTCVQLSSVRIVSRPWEYTALT